jgi:uncharacterized protein (DUF885 family)
MPHRTVRDYENIIARLGAIPAYVDQNIALLDEAIQRGDAQPRLVAGLVAKQLAAQMAQRFQAMTQPASAYSVTLQRADPQASPRLVWSATEQGQPVSFHTEPARSPWQKFEVHALAVLPVDREL